MPKDRVLYDPDNEKVQAFVAASQRPMSRGERARLEAGRPALELLSPGLLSVLDLINVRSLRGTRRVARLRRDLRWVHREATRMGLLP